MDNLVCHSEPEPAPLQMSQSILNDDAAVLPPVSHTYVNPNELHGRQPQAINFASQQMQHLIHMQQTSPSMLVQQTYQTMMLFV